MEKFGGLLEAFLNFLFVLFGDLGIFGEDSKMPDVLKQYYEDAKTVINAAKD